MSRPLQLSAVSLIIILTAAWGLRVIRAADAADPSLASEHLNEATLPPWLHEPDLRIRQLASRNAAANRASRALTDAVNSVSDNLSSGTFAFWMESARSRVASRDWQSASTLAAIAAELAADDRSRALALRLKAWAAIEGSDADRALSAVDELQAALPSSGSGQLEWLDALLCARANAAAGDITSAELCAEQAQTLGPHQPMSIELDMTVARATLRTSDDPRAIADAIAAVRGFPEYPNQDSLTLEIAAAQERSGHPRAAAHTLEERLFTAPWRPMAPQLERELTRLVEAGAPARTRSLQERLERGQALRFARHWPIAERALTSLLTDALSQGQSTEFIGRIETQRMLNAYEDQRYAEAEAIAKSLMARSFRGGQPRLILITMLRAISRQEGRLEEAWSYAKEIGERYPTYIGPQQLEELAFDLGFFADSLEIARERRSRAWLRGFSGIFLRYLAGDPQSAAAFDELVERSRGEQADRARYWAGRSYARNGDLDTAERRFEELVAQDQGRAAPANFYRMAAHWRLYDIQERRQLIEARRAVDHAQDAPAQAQDSEARDPAEDAAEETLVPTFTTPLSIGERPNWAVAALGSDRPARIHWRGPDDELRAGFEHTFQRDIAIPYGEADFEARLHTLSEFTSRWGEEWSEAAIATELLAMGLESEARQVFRHILIEERQLRSAGQRSALPLRSPLELPSRSGGHLIDHRRAPRGWWGAPLNSDRYPVPSAANARNQVSKRQSRLLGARAELRADLFKVAVALNDAHFVRRIAIADSSIDGRELYRNGLAYAQQMLTRCREHDLSPWLMWSLMIVESDFNPDSVSIADAYGLLQVIPRTGELMALRLAEEDFGIHQLLDPAESIRFGTAYLREVLDKFHDQEFLALVGYNAGPHQVARWIEWRGEILAADEWLESLPFATARSYAHNIVLLMTNYSSLYGQGANLYIGNRLDTNTLNNIYF